MRFRDLTAEDAAAVGAVMDLAFSASEGPEEGAAIGGLAHRLLSETQATDIHGFGVGFQGDGGLSGAILFSRVRYPRDPRQVFILSPVAVDPVMQGQGMGQALIRHGLSDVKARGGQVALTYGDPEYYGRLGFNPVTVDEIAAPYPLSQPHGWLAQGLDGTPPAPLPGPCSCVPALSDPAFW